MGAIFRREFRSYFRSIVGFLFVACCVLCFGIFSFDYNFFNQSSSIAYSLSNMLPVVALLIPIVSVNSILGEYKSGSYRLLYSLPLSSSQIFFGKYFAMISLMAIPTAIMALLPFVLNFFGKVNFVASFGALLAFFLFGTAFISINLFISAISGSTVSCALVSYIVAVLLYVVNLVTALIKIEWLDDILSRATLFGAFDKFVDNVFDLKAIIYYLSVTVIFALLSYRTIDKKQKSM